VIDPVLSRISIDSRRLAVVEVEHATQPLAPLDDPVMVNSGWMPSDQSIA
jgi:hypothetical protein